MDASSGGDRMPRGGAFAAPRGYALSGKIMLSAIVVLFSVVLFVLFLHLYARWYVLRRVASRHRRRRRRPLVFAAEGPASRGLDSEVLKSIPVHAFSAAACEGSEAEAPAECAVCLNEFEEGEKVRTLPRCRHGFHVECIDMWFYSHATCPLCRSAVDTPPPPHSSDAVVVTIPAEEAPAPPQPAQPLDLLCTSCLHDEAGGSSSAGSVELSVEVPARRGEGLYRGREEEVSSPGGGFKSPGGRISSLKRLLRGDSRLYRGGSAAEPDPERGEGAAAAPALMLNEYATDVARF